MFGIFKKVGRLEHYVRDTQKELQDIKTPFIFNIGDKVRASNSPLEGVVCGFERLYYRDEEGFIYAAQNEYSVLIGDSVRKIYECYLQKFTQVKSKKNEKKAS